MWIRNAALIFLSFFLVLPGSGGAGEKPGTAEGLPAQGETGIKALEKTGEPEYEMVEIARVKIVPDAAWRCDKAFDPPVLTIKAGTTVEWTNLDRETHSVVSSTGSQPCYLKAKRPSEREIQASQLPHSKKYRKQFDEPGEYQYACHLPSHHMAGKIIVTP